MQGSFFKAKVRVGVRVRVISVLALIDTTLEAWPSALRYVPVARCMTQCKIVVLTYEVVVGIVM